MNNEENNLKPKFNRREFFKRGAIVTSGIAALIGSLGPLSLLKKNQNKINLFNKHYKELSKEELEAILLKLTDEIKNKYNIISNLKDITPMNNTQFAYALNLSKCIGCRKCVYACIHENNIPKNSSMQYIRVVKMPKNSLDLNKADHYYSKNDINKDKHYYMPIQCHQCENPPCVKVCPVNATWKDKDGITVIDYEWCIGCRYCEAACPYFARKFNFKNPALSKSINPDMAYLSNRPRYKGVMEKCTFCLQRTRLGKHPFCVEACPTGARKFGNLLDSSSKINQILKEKKVFVLKEEAGTIPRFFYYFD